jgi:hypothetical protein
MANIDVIGVVPNDSVAGQLVGNLRIGGIDQDQISVLVVTHEEENQLAQDDSKAGKGISSVATKAAIGAAIGLVIGVAAGFGILAMPGMGRIIGTGVFLALFGGMGAVIGALLGFYAGERESSQVIERYGMALREGQAVVTVTVPDADHAKHAEEMFRAAGAKNINSYLTDEGSVTNEAGIKGLKDLTKRA